MNQSESPPTVKSAARAIDVLELLAAHPDGLSLLQIGQRLGMAKSSSHALMATLLERGVVQLRQQGRSAVYRLGHRIFEIGQAYAQVTDLITDGQAAARTLSTMCSETAHLAALDGTSVVYLAKHDGEQPVRMVSAVGKRLPAYATGVGKVLLAGLTDDEIDARFGAPGALRALTPRTTTTLEQLLAEVAAVRERGFSTEREESTEGVGCAAAPVYDVDGLIAGLSVSVPIARFTVRRQDEFATSALTVATELSIRLGAGRYPATIAPGTTREAW